MKERNIIMETKKPNTVKTLYEDFLNLGINRDDILLVHSSMSSMGWICGGAQAVITALKEAIGSDGTIVMPAQSGDWTDPAGWEKPPVPKEWIQIIYDNMPAFDPQVTPTRGMGRIAELFRTVPNTIRSNHPQRSFSANGKAAAYITKDHPLTPHFGIESPLGKMYNLKTKVLLLGVDYDSCTSFHLAETLIDEMPKERLGAAIMENGERCWKWFEDYAYDIEGFELIGKEFEEKCSVQVGKIGNADCRLFDMKEAVDFAKDWLIKNRFNK
ncbi:aminoglycoside N(3)-acetyltransferase [Clostridium folliculivorans]|uniref:Aminoglycoside N(3)-acetyltransferase n=1 Tax=Clostridium folliculivorans TaxID=2886038 RepID=A0A9W5Y0N8_9CLOT|nr:AAC(3) family N-acetyltransferase [Clostridium folliculivorans]GKU24416.1 AAC(3) family N-acetyltransferase [Clostridium folliculivorans]GKU30512.1 AAC(3) family N-acetyltransferase [Clostridium folliculivorans]